MEKKRDTVAGISPAPVGPTMAVVVPAATVKLTCFKPLKRDKRKREMIEKSDK